MNQFIAKAINSIVVIRYGKFEDADIYYVTSNCFDYRTYRSLPNGVSFEGREYGKAGWNSDKGIVEYRSDWKLAKPI